MIRIRRNIEDYKDIIDRPHYVSEKRAKMPVGDRAAQFAPFAAMVGHEAAIKETARYTDRKKELDETEKGIIDEKLSRIEEHLDEKPEVEVVYFVPDTVKVGGSYETHSGRVSKLDHYGLTVEFDDGMKIAIDEIYSISL